MSLEMSESHRSGVEMIKRGGLSHGGQKPIGRGVSMCSTQPQWKSGAHFSLISIELNVSGR